MQFEFFFVGTNMIYDFMISFITNEMMLTFPIELNQSFFHDKNSIVKFLFFPFRI